tara:strand:- start:1079 stop:1321 length:243 start_codon:yes stop_codon:yes gene_type:complete
MGSLFGSSSPPPPDTSDLDERESKLERQENEEKRKIASRSRARRTGGSNLLMTQREGGSAVGNPTQEQTTLGYARNSRNV